MKEISTSDSTTPNSRQSIPDPRSGDCFPRLTMSGRLASAARRLVGTRSFPFCWSFPFEDTYFSIVTNYPCHSGCNCPYCVPIQWLRYVICNLYGNQIKYMASLRHTSEHFFGAFLDGCRSCKIHGLYIGFPRKSRPVY